MNDDLVTWLRARLDEDERIATAVHHFQCASAVRTVRNGVVWDLGDCDCNQPARVLAEVAAKRAILDAYAWALGHPAASTDGETGYWFRKGGQSTLSETVLLLAQPYADRPGFRDEWRVPLDS